MMRPTTRKGVTKLPDQNKFLANQTRRYAQKKTNF